MNYTQLYNTTDVKRVREKLLKEQEGQCALTGLEIPPKQAVLDHDHKSNYVRAVLHRQVNVMVGKIENAFDRYMAYWYPGSLADFLEDCMMYLDKEQPRDYLHPGWIKSTKAKFNKLNSRQKDYVLNKFNCPSGKNDTERKNLFSKLLLDKSLKYDTILQCLTEAKENYETNRN